MWVDIGMGGFQISLSDYEQLSYSEIIKVWQRVKKINETEENAYNSIKNQIPK